MANVINVTGIRFEASLNANNKVFDSVDNQITFGFDDDVNAWFFKTTDGNINYIGTAYIFTYAELQIQVTESQLERGQFYYISDKDIIIQATSSNTYAAGALYTTERLSQGAVVLTSGAAGSVDTLTVNNVNIITGAVPFNTSLAQTATDLATDINTGSGSHGYTATAIGTTVVLRPAAGTGDTPNGFVVAGTNTTLTLDYVDFSGGINSGAEWNEIVYDFTNDNITERYDPKRNCRVKADSDEKAVLQALYSMDPFDNFPWMDNNVKNIEADNSIVNIEFTQNTIQNIRAAGVSMVSIKVNNNTTPGGAITGIEVTGASQLDVDEIGPGGRLSFCMIENQGAIDIDTLNGNFVNNIVELEGKASILTVDASSGMEGCLLQDCELEQVTLSVNLSGTISRTGKPGSNRVLTYDNNLGDSLEFTLNRLRNDANAQVTIAANTIDFDDNLLRFRGKYAVQATATLQTVANAENTSQQFELRPAPGTTLIVNELGNIAIADSIGTTATLVGSNGDYAVCRQEVGAVYVTEAHTF